MRRVIAATLMLCGSAFKVVGRTDVVPPGAAQDVNPSHKSVGRPGLEPGTNALKGR
jgi:hypothetical protein